MRANVICENNDRYMIPFKITSKNLNSSSFKLKLFYPNPSNISMSQISDKLEIMVVEQIQVLKGSRTVLLREGIFTSENIPPQLIGEVAHKITNYIENGRITFTRFTPLNVAIGIGAQLLWL